MCQATQISRQFFRFLMAFERCVRHKHIWELRRWYMTLYEIRNSVEGDRFFSFFSFRVDTLTIEGNEYMNFEHWREFMLIFTNEIKWVCWFFVCSSLIFFYDNSKTLIMTDFWRAEKPDVFDHVSNSFFSCFDRVDSKHFIGRKFQFPYIFSFYISQALC